MLGPIRAVDRCHLDFAAAARRMNEAVVAEIDADMRIREAPCVEEHEIARLEFSEGDLVADARKFARGTRQRDAGDFLEHELDEATAVEAGLGCRAAPFVADAEQAERARRQVLRGLPCVGRDIRGAGDDGRQRCRGRRRQCVIGARERARHERERSDQGYCCTKLGHFAYLHRTIVRHNGVGGKPRTISLPSKSHPRQCFSAATAPPPGAGARPSDQP